ncbi:MAG: hypothetical protein NXI01_02935 [Gammaproteobacteria bacterium]|nr:hypothetical protein [Gammaproteobacteria bacterium]
MDDSSEDGMHAGKSAEELNYVEGDGSVGQQDLQEVRSPLPFPNVDSSAVLHASSAFKGGVGFPNMVDVASAATDLHSLNQRFDEATANAAVMKHRIEGLDKTVADQSADMYTLNNGYSELAGVIAGIENTLQWQGSQIRDILRTRPDSQDSKRRDQAAEIQRDLSMLSMEITNIYHSVAKNNAEIKAAQKSPEQLVLLRKTQNALNQERLDLVKKYMSLAVAGKFGTVAGQRFTETNRNIQERLADIFRKANQRDTAPKGWLPSMTVAQKALDATARLSRNAAVSHPRDKRDDNLKAISELLDLMTYASFMISWPYGVLNAKSYTTDAAVSAAFIDSDSVLGATGQDISFDFGVGATPDRKSLQLDARFSGISRTSTSAPIDEVGTAILDDNTFNTFVRDTLIMGLNDIKNTSNALLGHGNETWRLVGNVLKIAAIAIGVMLAVSALAYIAGFSMPVVIAGYLATLKAGAIVSTVLEVAATKLGLGATFMAASTTVAAATMFGAFGHMAHVRAGIVPSNVKKAAIDAAEADIAALNNLKFGGGMS